MFSAGFILVFLPRLPRRASALVELAAEVATLVLAWTYVRGRPGGSPAPSRVAPA